MTGKAGRGSDQFMLRLPEGMRDRIKLFADQNGRSMNAEIVATLEEKYPGLTLTEALVHTLVRRLDEMSEDNRAKIQTEISRLLAEHE